MGAELIGTVLDGRYRVVERLAEGAMGIVYRAERVKLGRSVAIKFLHGWNAIDAQARKRFEVEAKAMARLEHPHCAAVIDVGEHDGAPYVVMDFVRGATLREILDDGALPVARAAEIVRQVLSGLAHAHELGIIHRDIKPANIMVGDQAGIGETVKILDFGLARFRGAPSGLTVGIAIGTPSYMAPEQITGDAVDPRTDLYACGVLLFEILTGDKPYTADEPLEVLRLHREAPVPRPSDVVEASSRDDVRVLDEVVVRALQKVPAERFDSAAAFARAIDAALRSGARPVDTSSTAALAAPALPPSIPPAEGAAIRPGDAPMPAPVARTSRRWIAIGVAAAAGLTLIGIVAMLVTAGEAHRVAPDAVAARGNGTTGPTPDAMDPSADVVVRARAMASDGNSDDAIALLDAARKTFPDRAALSFEMGRLYFAKLWWRDGLDAFRAAIRVDPTLRADPDLIKLVLRGFIMTPDTDPDLARFLLSDVGPAAVPYLEETARTHPSEKVRARAATLLTRFH